MKWLSVPVIFLLLISSSCSSRRKSKQAQASPAAIEQTTDLVCKSSREFITTLGYLREKKEFALNEKQAQEISHKVAQGCSDASKRFIETTELLVKAELDAKKAMEYGLKNAASTNAATDAFTRVFKESFVTELLDLDLNAALETAYTLSSDFSGSYSDLSNDFNFLVRFCVEQKSLGLPLKDCATYAARLTKLGGTIKSPVAKSFQRGYDFLTRPEKANLATQDALKTLERILPFGEQGLDNFIQAFDYAISEKGLSLSVRDAIEFSLRLASLTKQQS
jgi:hypothetical protein